MQLRLERLQMRDEAAAGREIDRFELASLGAECNHRGTLVGSGGERQRDSGRKHAGDSPGVNARFQQQSSLPGRMVGGRFAAQVERFIDRHANGER